MIWLTEDICVVRSHISAVEWTGLGECRVTLLSGSVFNLKNPEAQTVWSLLTDGVE